MSGGDAQSSLKVGRSGGESAGEFAGGVDASRAPEEGAVWSFEQAASMEWAGGKARGLGRLVQAGLPVPEGFVVLTDSRAQLPEEFWKAWRRLDGPVAVRSSARDEDGTEMSFAGQFETVLGVSTEEELAEAVQTCVESVRNARVRAYRADLENERGDDGDRASAPMALVVQRMVDAKVAGVLFTVDPATGRRDRVVVDVVSGLGEKLVSGRAQSVHYELSRQGEVVGVEGAVEDSEQVGEAGAGLLSDQSWLGGEGLGPDLDESFEDSKDPDLSENVADVSHAGQGWIDERDLQTLVRQALVAEQAMGGPLDMEWAMDQQGRIWWLQARPATALPADPQEFDTPVRPGDLFTSSNFGEMMPGAVPPLTMSLTGWSIDQGIQELLVASGVMKERTEQPVILAFFWGHMFANLRPILDLALKTAGSSPEYAMIALCGRVIPDVEMGPRASSLTRVLNAAGYMKYVLSGARAAKDLERLTRGFRLSSGRDARQTWQFIDDAKETLLNAMDLHLRSSAVSGLTNGILHTMVAGHREPTPQDSAVVADLLAGVGDVESAVLVADLGGVIEAVAQRPDARERFVESEPVEALSWLRSAGSGVAGARFDGFLLRHGHRAFRELSFREPSWRDEPLSLVRSMQLAVAERLSQDAGKSPDHGAPDGNGRGQERASLSGKERMERAKAKLGKGKGWLLKIARKAVWWREHTKSLLVRVGDEFKRAYRTLAKQAVSEGLLPDQDAVYFLTHQEVGQLVRTSDPDLRSGIVHLALARRRVYPIQERAQFPDVFTEPPDPFGAAATVEPDGRTMVGRPVSPGKVVGRARVVASITEAAEIQLGEILVAPVTDVGWTPYFRVIGGLATDVGSAISHGAVVAREYGLPAVVGLRSATAFVRTGEMVELDGTAGTLRKL